MKQRFLSVFLCFSLLFGLPLSCFCNEPISENSGLDAKAYVLYALESVCESIPLTNHPMTVQEAVSLYQELLETEPQLFYVQPKISYAFNSQGFVTAIYPTYTMSSDRIAAARQEIKTYIEAFLLKRDETMSEGDLALLVHDHLASSYTYSPAGLENYDIYAMLTDGHGVCQAFSLMYILLGRSVDLEVDMVTSLPMDHAWNHVKVGASYYHVDVTRDLAQGSVSYTHERFLVSDSVMERLGYHGYSCRQGHLCLDHEYETLSVSGHYESIFFDVLGTSLYMDEAWLALDQNLCFMTLRLGEFDKSQARLTEGADTNGDGVLSLSDVLHPNIQNAPREALNITNTLRQIILKQIIHVQADP